MATTASDLLSSAPTNPVYNTGYRTQTDKAWARAYHPIQNLVVHTQIGEDGKTRASFAAFHPWYDDDDLRMASPAVAPNHRSWRLECEADCELWFHSEVSNVVLAAWNHYRGPPRVNTIAEEVDATYSIKSGTVRTVIAIGEMKRNLLSQQEWQQGNLERVGQLNLSRELRGYADKYQCPQVFCFDGNTLVLLQFRANTPEEIRAANCPVDCLALYMLLAQGFRRFQGLQGLPQLTVCGHTPPSRLFFDGLPVWRSPENTLVLDHPGGYLRSVDAQSGAIRWTNPEDGDVVWETGAFWGEHAVQ